VTLSRTALWLLWLVAYAATTGLLYVASDLPAIRVSHAVLAYMVLIIVASRQGGRALAIAMVVLGYLAVDWFYVPPRFSFGDASDLDWIVLIGFVLTGWLVSELFAKQREATRIAEERTREVERLSLERLQLEREASTARVLREADRLKNALLSSLAHDLRSPVATLSLLADPAAGFASTVALQRVGEEAERLSEYIATLQRFASDGGGSVLSVERYDAKHLVHTALRSSEALLAGRTVRVEPSPRPWPVQCDLTLSVQVLSNLLQNAVRYAPLPQPIDISVSMSREPADMVQITVADRGPGVSDADVERLFMPLHRASATVNTGGEGAGIRMGMGLSIARTFARAQRGDVTYTHREGGGAEFTLRLPIATDT
jgi:two-component system sensor histidine kinase KdpD